MALVLGNFGYVAGRAWMASRTDLSPNCGQAETRDELPLFKMRHGDRRVREVLSCLRRRL